MSRPTLLRIETLFAVVAVALVTFIFNNQSRAEIIYELKNHRDGNAGGNYGLRLDKGSELHTFNFDPLSGADVGVELSISNGNSFATISGKVRHNQSNEIWKIDAVLSSVTFTDDGVGFVPWNTSNIVNEGMLEELRTRGDPFPSPDNDARLKDPSVDADRIGFNTVTLTMMLMSAASTDGYDGPTTLYDYPNGDGSIPFVFSKGFRTNDNTLTGAGWLSEDDPMNGSQSRGGTRDFLFEIGRSFSPGSGTPVPEPTTIVLFGMGLAVVGSRRVRRK